MKKDKPLKLAWEYEITPDSEEKLQEIYDNILEGDKILADMLIKYHTKKENK